MILPLNEIYIYTNGVLLSRRYITTESGTPITQADISSITLNVYKLEGSGNGTYTRTKVHTASLDPINVIENAPATDPKGNLYNFRYCVEGIFDTPNTLYLVEYDMLTATNHHIIVLAKGRTLD